MDDNPYRAPISIPERPPQPTWKPDRHLAFLCGSFAALFALFAGAACSLDWPPGLSGLIIGCTASTSAGLFSIGWGLLTGRRSPMIAGACIVLAALAIVFTLVISFAGD
jgi:hypothetical protein